MSTYEIRPASRSEAKPLIGLYAESGCGKTWSALLLARGFVGPSGKIIMLETEGGRGEAYADILPGGYGVCSLRGNFAPAEYGQALTAIERAKPDALIIDSASHEWEGSGGVLSMAAGNQADGKKGVLVWQQPKMEHQRHFMLRLLATPIPLVVVCMRAKYPMIEGLKDGKKEWMRSDKLEPKQSEDMLFELFLHGWIDRDHKFHGTKYTREELRQVFKDGEPLSIATGERLAAWSRGGKAASSNAGPVAPGKPASTEARGSDAVVPGGPPTAGHSAAAAVPTAGAENTAAPIAPEPELPMAQGDLEAEREVLLGRIKGAADARKLSARVRADLWQKHCPGAGPDNVDLSALADLYNAITKGAAA